MQLQASHKLHAGPSGSEGRARGGGAVGGAGAGRPGADGALEGPAGGERPVARPRQCGAEGSDGCRGMFCILFRPGDGSGGVCLAEGQSRDLRLPLLCGHSHAACDSRNPRTFSRSSSSTTWVLVQGAFRTVQHHERRLSACWHRASPLTVADALRRQPDIGRWQRCWGQRGDAAQGSAGGSAGCLIGGAGTGGGP